MLPVQQEGRSHVLRVLRATRTVRTVRTWTDPDCPSTPCHSGLIVKPSYSSDSVFFKVFCGDFFGKKIFERLVEIRRAARANVLIIGTAFSGMVGSMFRFCFEIRFRRSRSS